MSGRSRIWQRAWCTAGQTESIAFSYQLPFNATLLQFHIACDDVPTVDDCFVVIKDSFYGAIFDVTIKSVCLFTEGLAEMICSGVNVEFRMGDKIVVTYPNTDDQNVGVEMVFTEGD